MWKKKSLFLVLVMCEYLISFARCARVKIFCFSDLSVEGSEAPYSQEYSQS